jgi:hypothetical protein
MLQFVMDETDTFVKGWNIKVMDSEKPCMISEDFLRQLSGLILAAQKEKNLMHLTIWLPTFHAKHGKISLSGGDLGEMELLQKKPEEQKKFFSRVRQSLIELSDLPCLTSVCFDGSVIGGGVEFISAFDLRWSTEDSVIWCPQLFNGLCSGFGGEVFLRNKFGQGLAEHLLYTGKKMQPADLPPHFYAGADARSLGELENSVKEHLFKYDHVSNDALQWQKNSVRVDTDLELNVLQNKKYENFLKSWVAKKSERKN